MAIDFPASPTTGQTFDPGTGIVYSFDGVAWNAVTTSTATARSKNLLINPAMMISQENGATAVTANNAYPIDQWWLAVIGVVGWAAQGSASITPERSPFTLGTTVTTAKASLAAGDYDMLIQSIEGLQMAELQWGTARAIPAVLRFSAVATATGTYSFSISSGAGDQTYIGSFTVPTGGMQTFVIPIPATTAGTWAKDNTRAAALRFVHCCGSTNIGVLGWQSGSLFAAPGQINAAATANQYLTIGDVGLYADPAATGLAPTFEIPVYATELVKCMRYWSKFNILFSGNATNGTAYNAVSNYPVPPRIAPTLAGVNVSNFSFAATVGTLSTIGGSGVTEQRNANATAGASFQTTITASARM